MTTGNVRRTRGRPQGSYKEQRRQRKDHRFMPDTLSQIEQGRALLPGQPITETAFLERAIGHYMAFLTGEAQQQDNQQELERLRAQVADLERKLDLVELSESQARTEIMLLKKKAKQQGSVQAPESKYPDLRKSYQIYVMHEGTAHPALPEGFQYGQAMPDDDMRCPTHEVFSQVCPIARARREVERLKSVPGLKRIWLAKMGNGLTKGGGARSDNWARIGGRWESQD